MFERTVHETLSALASSTDRELTAVSVLSGIPEGQIADLGGLPSGLNS